MEAVTYAAFAGHFTFAGGKSLPPLVGTGGPHIPSTLAAAALMSNMQAAARQQ